MIAVGELDRIARARLDDAKSLLAAGRFDGATYVCGYAVEVALKARICRTLNWSEFPATSAEFVAYKSSRTHELEVLLRFSGQKGSIKQSPDSRYNSIGTALQAATESMIQATDELLEAL